MPLFLYVLELAEGRWYVGTTREPNRRLQEHRTGQGAEWTRRFPPIAGFRELQRLDCPDHEARLQEDACVKALMLKKSIDVVRGGSYSHPDLTRDDMRLLCRELFHATNGCMRCGRTSHWIATCHAATDVVGNVIEEPVATPSSSNITSSAEVCCRRCGRASHATDACYATTDTSGRRLDDMDVEEYESNSEEEEDDAEEEGGDCCFRCGRPGHWVSQCYARCHANGRML